MHTETGSISYGGRARDGGRGGGGGGEERQTDRERQTQRKRKKVTETDRNREKDSREAEEKRDTDTEKETQNRHRTDQKTGCMRWLQKKQIERMTNFHTQIWSQLTCLSCPFREDLSALLP